eukprot:gene13389-15754_t
MLSLKNSSNMIVGEDPISSPLGMDAHIRYIGGVDYLIYELDKKELELTLNFEKNVKRIAVMRNSLEREIKSLGYPSIDTEAIYFSPSLSILPPLPSSSSSSSSEENKNTLYDQQCKMTNIMVVGGVENTLHLKTSRTYNLESGQWSQSLPMCASRACSSASVVSIKTHLFAFGGNDCMDSLDRYDVQAKTWKSLPISPVFDRIDQYDIVTGRSVRIGNLLTPRYYAFAQFYKDNIYVIGGTNKDSSGAFFPIQTIEVVSVTTGLSQAVFTLPNHITRIEACCFDRRDNLYFITKTMFARYSIKSNSVQILANCPLATRRFVDKVPEVCPDTVTHLTFSLRFNESIRRGSLMDTITHLTFGGFFNQPLESGMLPSKLTHLTLNGNWNHPITPGMLPHGLTHLVLDSSFDQPLVNGSLVDTLHSLKFGYYYNQPIGTFVLPESLRRLKFGDKFNKHVHLPPYLMKLTFGTEYDQDIVPGSFPDSLTYLKFGSQFQKDIPQCGLPASLKRLEFGAEFNRPILRGVLPATLTHLGFGVCFRQMITPGVLPATLKELWFNADHQMPRPGKCNTNHQLSFGAKKVDQGVLPQSLQRLVLSSSFSQKFELGSLPRSLTHLEVLYESYRQIIDPGVLTNVTHLTLGHYHSINCITPKNAPPTLTHLTLLRFTAHLQDLPKTLTHLTLGDEFGAEIKDKRRIEPAVLPEGLKYLRFGYNFDQELKKGMLPSSLVHLTLGVKYQKEITPGILPTSITSLSLENPMPPIIPFGAIPSVTNLSIGVDNRKELENQLKQLSSTQISLHFPNLGLVLRKVGENSILCAGPTRVSFVTPVVSKKKK